MHRPYNPTTTPRPSARRILAASVCALLGSLYPVGGGAQVLAGPTTSRVSGHVSDAVQAAESVAKVALVVGTAERILPGGRRQALTLGSALFTQDRIATGNDALVMLVFSDQARMALRPDTELIIRSYQIDPSGSNTKIDFELVRGTVRQISGQGTRLQPERYRLNTPIAAIGVRGTDFLARVDQDKVQTYVHEGSIVLLPPSSDCGAHRGICDIWATVNASDAGQYVAVSAAGQVVRSVATPEDVNRLFGIKIAAAATPPAANLRQGTNVAAASLSAVSDLPRSDSREVFSASVPPSTSLPAVTVPPELPSQLVWGRFSDPLTLPLSLPASYQEARAGRHVTVGQLGQYALWRDNPGGQLDTSLRGQAEFSLTQSEAFYATGGQSLPVQLSNPSLSVNFDNLTFATRLSLSGAAVPAASLAVSGRMNDEGVFAGTNAQGQRVAGALARNAAQAGYFFTSPGTGAAHYEGLTLWRSK